MVINTIITIITTTIIITTTTIFTPRIVLMLFMLYCCHLMAELNEREAFLKLYSWFLLKYAFTWTEVRKCAGSKKEKKKKLNRNDHTCYTWQVEFNPNLE